MADIHDVINESWEGHTKGEVETALKGKLREIGNTDTFNVGLTVVTPPAIVKDTNVKLSVKGTSIVIHPGNIQEEVAETLVIEIQTKTSIDGSWVSKPSNTVTANTSAYKEIDISSYLVEGINYIRLRAVGNNASSMWYQYEIRVVNLQLFANNVFEIPISGDYLTLNYLIGGAIAKTLYVEIGTGKGTQFVSAYSTKFPLGEFVNITTGLPFTFESAPSSIMSAGKHTVRAYLQADEDSTVKTDVIESQYMVAGSSDIVIVNNVNNTLDNYTDVTFFDYAVFTTGESLPVIFKLKDSTSEVVLNSWEFTARNNTKYVLSTDLSLEIEEKVKYAYMIAEDTNGNQISDKIYFTINNEAKFAPVKGAEFILSPANRSNEENNPQTIINAANGNIIPSTWVNFDMQSDGYMAVNKDVNDTSANADKVRALHIPANRKLTINYNPLSQFINANSSPTGLVGKHMTLEIDFRAYNVTDENETIIKLGSTHNDGDIYGFEMKPLEATLLTKNSRVRDDQNVSWAEGERTRLTLNILYGLNPNNDPTRPVNYNFVRMFINDVIEREFFYEANDSFLAETTNLVIGAVGSDIDIFSIRCYQKALSTNDVMQDYVSGLSTSAEKVQWQIKNNILGDNDMISFSKAQAAGYNVIGHTGKLPKRPDDVGGGAADNPTYNVSIYIGIHGDPKRSGTLYNLDGKGQGTTAMTYYHWNQQYKIKDTTTWVPDVAPEAGDGSNYNFGKNGYAIAAGEAFAKKLVGKINFASSQQGHKLGLTWAYTDLFKELVKRSNISNPGQIAAQPNARISVYQKPFLFFHRETENDPWTFKYLMTFGAGKGDKPTFGFNKNTTPNMLMVEGADNDVPMALFATPWDNSVTYDTDEEAWIYGNMKNINFGFGKTTEIDGQEYPAQTDGLNAIKEFWNFVYLHNTSIIRFYDGTLEQLQNNIARPQQGATGSVAPSTNYVYWLTDDNHLYEMYKYNANTAEWINAGINGASLNVRTLYETYCEELEIAPSSWSVGQWAEIARIIKTTFTNHFRNKASEYIHIDDALYHSCFIKLFAGTDNRAKNTYYYVDPVTLKIRFEQDDLDTTIKTNNVGQNRKPYYVEEHDKDAAGAFYWQGESNGFYNLLEDAFSSEMTAMMKNMFSCMAAISGNVMQFMLDYVLFAQDYFPATAFNEMARTVYENSAVAQNDGIYINNNARAITQSNGSQRWSEYEWLRDRIMYLSSWCEFGEFDGDSLASGALGFRGAGATQGTTNVYNFTLTPAKWLYPRISRGKSNMDASATSRRVRVQAGQAFNYKGIEVSSDSAIAIKGINYYLEIGNMNVPLSTSQTEFAFIGKKLQKVTINPTGEENNLFITQKITIDNAINIKEFIVRGVNTINSIVNLSKCVRLEKIDIRESSIPSIDLPNSAALTEIRYPAQIQEINIVDKPKLQTVTIDGTDYLQNVTSRRTSDVVAKAVIDILEQLNN